jgi:hypothetical protein
MLAADNWCVKVDDKIYGPYTSQQLRKFAHEGRLAAWSKVAPAGSRSWKEAREEGALAAFFGETPTLPRRDGPTFGKRDTADAADARTDKSDGQDGRRTRVHRGSASPAAAEEYDVANFVIVFDVVSAAATRVETAVLSLGPAFRIADNVWAVTCEMTAVGVRNAIAPYLRPGESIFVVDATRGRSSWQNFAPETHAKLNAAWSSARH